MMTNTLPLRTKFAPAERASAASVAADVEYFQNQLLLHEFFAAVPELFVVLNEQRQIVFANEAVLKAFNRENIGQVAGLRAGEAVGCTYALHGDGDLPGDCGTTEFCRTCGAVHAMMSALHGSQNEQECRIVLDDNNVFDLRVTARPFQQGKRSFVLFAVQDISDEKRRHVLERIFFHDLLNTAGGMLGVAELLRSGTPDDVENFKDTVSVLAHSLVDEIRAQQTLLAAEQNDLQLSVTEIDSLALLLDVRDMYQNHDVCVDRKLVVDRASASLLFASDPALVRRVVGNMVKNALEACRRHETVTLSACTCDDGVEFRVHNPGVMPRSVQLQVFQRSFSSKGEGRGLGTYSMKLLSERYLSGKVGFTSDAESGTIFYARYPLVLEIP